jgi:hypothetical protein
MRDAVVDWKQDGKVRHEYVDKEPRMLTTKFMDGGSRRAVAPSKH